MSLLQAQRLQRVIETQRNELPKLVWCLVYPRSLLDED